MSFLFGNYITLTNLRQRDVDRILSMHISPVNISVHTTDPALRVAMMGNPQAGESLEIIPKLAQGGILINAQLVLCPGVNDGPHLERTLTDLCRLAPQVQSVAVVPLGLTRHRRGLAALEPYTPEGAAQVIDTVDAFGQRMLDQHGQRICYAADEFYLCAGRTIPSPAYYGEYPQLENGVGMLALLEDEFTQALALEEARPVNRRVTLATGTAAAPLMTRLVRLAEDRFPGLNVAVVPITNDFFGPTITVAGLVTGGDLLAQLTGRSLGDGLLLPDSMLRHEGDLFLDDLSIQQLSDELAVPIHPTPNDGFLLLEALLGL